MSRRERILRATGERAARPAVGSGVGVGRREAHHDTSPHASKFLIATVALIGIALVAVTVAVVTARNSTNAGPLPKWSSWSPPDGGLLGAREIADHLAPNYRISGADQLDAITVLNIGNPSNTGSNQSAPNNQITVALRQSSSGSGPVSLIGGKTVAFNLCGLGTSDCSIGTGTASNNRLLLLRREGLELALYTLHYIPGVQNVVAVLPPGHTPETSTLSPTPPQQTKQPVSKPLDLALLFDRQELQPWTSQPLSNTLASLPPSVPQLPAWRQTTEAALVDQLTARGLFADKFSHTADGSYLLVLNPVPPQ
jgi:hypothetical protein